MKNKKYTGVFSKSEFKVLNRFVDGSIVTEKDEIILDRYANIGFVEYGFDWDKMEETAQLTESGLNHLLMNR